MPNQSLNSTNKQSSPNSNLSDQVLVVIPTYNERENISGMISKILNLGANFDALVVDDNSPDGTGSVVEEIVAKEARVRIIHREGKAGRGSAAMAGFKIGFQGNYRYFIEIDADFSHNPEDIPRLLEKMNQYDVVIGSRYLPQSKLVNWGWKRIVFSHLANAYARAILRIPIRDYTNGYRCYRREVLEALNLDEFFTTGHIVLSEMAYRIHLKGYSIGEIPIVFVNRVRGQSNVSVSEVIKSFTSIWRIWRKIHKEK